MPTNMRADNVIAKPLYSENVCVIFLSNSIIAKLQKSIVLHSGFNAIFEHDAYIKGIMSG